MNKAGAEDLCGIGILGGKEDRDNRRGEIFAGSLGVEAVELIHASRRPIDLNVFLVIGDETRVLALIVVFQNPVRWSRIGSRIQARISSQKFRDRIHYGHLIVQVGSKSVLCVIELNTLG